MIGIFAQPFLLFLASMLPGADVPPGFVRIFNSVDLKGWHISEVSHHGNSRGWTIENGVLLATQDKPGNGGILLTDRNCRLGGEGGIGAGEW